MGATFSAFIICWNYSVLFHTYFLVIHSQVQNPSPLHTLGFFKFIQLISIHCSLALNYPQRVESIRTNLYFYQLTFFLGGSVGEDTNNSRILWIIAEFRFPGGRCPVVIEMFAFSPTAVAPLTVSLSRGGAQGKYLRNFGKDHDNLIK